MLQLLTWEHIDEVHYALFPLYQKKKSHAESNFVNGITVNNKVFLICC